MVTSYPPEISSDDEGYHKDWDLKYPYNCTMYETSKAAQVENEMRRYDIALLGICESRWNGSSCITLAAKQEFYDSLQGVLDHAPRRDIITLFVDLNDKIGSDNNGCDVRVKRRGDVASDHPC